MKISLKKLLSPKDSSDSATGRKKLSKKRMRIVAAVLVAIIAALGFFAYRAFWSGDKSKGGEITAIASIGTVSSVIEGSGTISALQQYEITSLKKGEVVADYFEEGDIVNEGDVLYLMDDTDGYDAIDNASSSVKRAQRNYTKATEDLANLVVKSKSNGVITDMYISEGDSVGANTKICDVIDNTTMILEIQFLSDYAAAFSAGSSQATVTLTKDGTVLYGTVTKVSTGSLINSLGASVTNVEIAVANPGAIKDGDYATAMVAGLACSSEGTFRYNGKSSVYSEVSGKVESLKVMKGDIISRGQTVALLSNDDISDISESRDNLADAQKQYSDAVEGLDDYVVKAPITGTIIQKNIKAGEKLEASNTSGAMAIIADLSALVFEMSVDELDISKLEEGMSVEVTADAIEGVTFGATVTNISIVGSSNNGVTSYPVKITIDSRDKQKGFAQHSYDKLIPGMNVSASVVIQKVEDVIVVPVSAVRRGNIVIVSDDSASEGVSMESMSPFGGQRPDFAAGSAAQRHPMSADSSAVPAGAKAFAPPMDSKPSGDADEKMKARMQNMIDSLDIPDGYKAIFVETGLSDESYIEIKRGLAEGDKVLLPDTTQAGSANFMMGGMSRMGGGMPAMGGGMPRMGGGMPSGMGGQSRSSMGGQNRAGGGMR